MIVRLDQNERSYEVDERGSAYIDYLHTQLELARELAKVVDSLNPQFPIGPGRLAQMKDLVKKILV